MNAWQVLRQIKSILAARTWPDSPGQAVFGSVLASVAPVASALGRLRMPVIFIAPSDSEVDQEEPTLEMQRFVARIIHRNASDPMGEASLIGGSRAAGGAGSTSGRGLLELEEQFLESVGNIDQLGGVNLRLNWRSVVEAVEDDELGYVTTREYRLEAWCSTQRSYAGVSRFRASDVGAGNALIQWKRAPNRFDRLGQVLRRAAGSTPPATPTDGAGISVSSTAESVTDAAGTGTWSYSLFTSYDEVSDAPATADRFSEAATVTVEVA